MKVKLTKKLLRAMTLAVIVMALGAVGAFIMEAKVFPYLLSSSRFSRWDFLQKARENVTIINKTETIRVQEDANIREISARASGSVVGVLSYDQRDPIARSMRSSGIILTSDGIIAAYAEALHPQATHYAVSTREGIVGAELQKVDSFSNIAFLKINVDNLPVMPLANSDELKSGQRVIGIGVNENYHAPVYNAGVINNFDKTFNISGQTVSYSEKMDGVIFSTLWEPFPTMGGVVINYNGEVIGLQGRLTKDNRAIYFQIPSNQLRTSLGKLFENKLGNEARLGLYYVPVTDALAFERNLPVSEGALVYAPGMRQGLAVISGLPAQQAGVQIGDIITHVGDEKVTLDQSLSRLINKHQAGEETTLKIWRDEKEMEIPVQF